MVMFGPRHQPGGAHLRQGSPRCNEEPAIVCRRPRLGASGPAGNPCLTLRLLEMEHSRPGKPTVCRVHNLARWPFSACCPVVSCACRPDLQESSRPPVRRQDRVIVGPRHDLPCRRLQFRRRDETLWCTALPSSHLTALSTLVPPLSRVWDLPQPRPSRA